MLMLESHATAVSCSLSEPSRLFVSAAPFGGLKK
jgi:hypothetical protein